MLADDGELSKNKNALSRIIESLQLNNSDNFSSAMQEELSFYIYEGTYTDDYVVVTDSMPWYDVQGLEADRLTQISTLYDRALKQLERVSQPKCEYSADIENFVFQREFSHWGQQLNAGSLINVELRENDVAALFLSTIAINYYDKTLRLTFGNRFNRLDPKALYENVLGNIHRTANSLNYVKNILYPIKSGEFDAFKEALASSRNLAKDAAINATNQEIVIDDTGLLGRRLNSDTQEYDEQQIKLTNKSLVFTDDSWDTCRTALGEIPLPDGSGETAYGLNAELLVGDLIMASDLRIVDKNNNPVISADESGIHANFVDSVKSGDDASSPNHIKNILTALDKEGFSFSTVLDSYKKYIRVGEIGGADGSVVGVKIVHDGEDDGFYSQFTADELAFFSKNESNVHEKNTWMTSDALNVRRARIFNDILLGCKEESSKNDIDYGKWAMLVDESGDFGIYWNG